MTVNANHRELVRAIAVGDTAKASELNAQIPASERDDLHTYVTAFFSLMLEQRFGDDASPEAIRTFVDEMRYDYRNAEPPIKPLMIEALIRASCGEDHLFDEIPGDETLRAEFLVIGKVAAQAPAVSTKMDEFLTEAASLTEEWASESQ